MARSRFYSATLGRDFTAEEWWAYCKEHPYSTSEVVVRHGQFGFNVHGVCLTPIRIVIHAKAGSTKYGEVANVSVAQSPCGAWSFATSSNSDYAVPAFQTDPTKPWCFKTEYDAIWAGLQQLEKKLLQDKHWVEQMEVARRRRMSDEDEEDNA